MRTPNQRHSPDEWEQNTEAVDLKIAQLSIMCGIRLLEPGVIKRVLDNDATVCDGSHANAFEELRGMVFLHYEMQVQLAHELPGDAAEIIARVRTHLLGRIGTQLGVPGPDDSVL